MTTSETISLGEAFDSVELPLGAAQSLLQWMGQQIGHDTEAGRALNEAGANLAAPSPPVTRSTSTSTTAKA